MGRMDGSGIGIGSEMVMDSVEALQGRIAQLEVVNDSLKRQVEKLKLGTIDHECDKRLKARIAELEAKIAMAPQPEAVGPRVWRSYSFGQPVECAEPSIATLKSSEADEEPMGCAERGKWREELDKLKAENTGLRAQNQELDARLQLASRDYRRATDLIKSLIAFLFN